jgi:hypothetical protein
MAVRLNIYVRMGMDIINPAANYQYGRRLKKNFHQALIMSVATKYGRLE